MDYCKTVRERFQESPSTYIELIIILRYYIAGRMDTESVLQKVQDLFRGHCDLIMGFNNFLPTEFQMDATLRPVPSDKPREVKLQSALRLIYKIKMRFLGTEDEHIYRSFLDIMLGIKTAKKNALLYKDIFLQVAALFKDHQDLICQFVDYEKY